MENNNVIIEQIFSPDADMDQYIVCNDCLQLIVQPNGKILSQYRQMSQRQKTVKLSLVKNQIQGTIENSIEGQHKKQLQEKSISLKNKQNDQHHNSTTKKHYKQKLQKITQRVIQSSRKLFRQIYEKQLNKLIIDNNLVYYRTKYNVIVIVVVKKFSIQISQIQQLMQKVFNWYYEKCVSMNIDINLPNVRIGQYEEGQFRKLEWEIANQIDEKVSKIEVTNNKVTHVAQRPKEQIVKDKLQHISQSVLNRDQKLKQIGEKVFFHDSNHSSTCKQQSMGMKRKTSSKIVDLFNNIFYQKNTEQKLPKMRKFKRQQSFMQKSVQITKQIRCRLFLFYFCLIVAVILGGMVYFGWFRESED